MHGGVLANALEQQVVGSLDLEELLLNFLLVRRVAIAVRMVLQRLFLVRGLSETGQDTSNRAEINQLTTTDRSKARTHTARESSNEGLCHHSNLPTPPAPPARPRLRRHPLSPRLPDSLLESTLSYSPPPSPPAFQL